MKRNLLLVMSALAVASLTVGCQGGKKAKTADTATQQQAILIKSAPAVKESVAQTIDFTSSLEPYQKNFITPSLAARIDAIYVDVGDRVTKGQLLVELDKTQYNTAALQLSNAEANMARMKPVYESGGLSKQQIDELETNINVLRESVNNLKTNVEYRSPIDGVVTGRFNEVGDLYTMSPNAAGGVGILQVMQINPLKATVAVPEIYYPQVHMSMPVKISAEVFPNEAFAGKVSRINPAINPATRTFDVEVTIPNKDTRLRPGMYARTTFDMGKVDGITVEDIAIQRQPGTNDKYLFVVKNGVAERRAITTGRQMGNRVEITSGLSEGEMVAVAGIARLVSGSKVTEETK